ncbi:fatty-acyl-CoA synthase [Ureibacillus xyleni]|uniref:Fatty-acyl-CoA synthase n=1 Tax=Ureibacillus xyleni TaxID=614648 RepID=A0A285TCI3_9BACL|nr:AMP-binding protein [Ureibacillus xyleni]SOC19710.1 fatty-acyl-CoA synthase [Ureibacillus xyleni]
MLLNGESWILKRASLTPFKIALIDIQTSREWTYEQLSNETLKWLNILQKKGLSKGNRVAFLAENSIDFFPILFACGLGGYIFVPLNWRLSEKELIQIVEDCTPTLLLTDHKFEQLGNRIFQHTSNLSCSDEEKADYQSMNIESTDPWLMIYTGGTTGKPKGVVLSFDAVNCNALNTIVSWGLEPSDCTLNYMPLFHTGGINALAMPILMVGGTVVIGNKFHPEDAIRAVNHYKTTISLFVPTMYQGMIETEYFKQANFPTVKVFLSGGAPCPKTIYDHFTRKGLQFKEGYGLTEAGPNNFYIHPELAAKKKGSVGKSMMFNAVQIKNSEGEICTVNEVGELYIQGKHMFTKYWNNENETKNCIENGWLKTGDLAKMDEDGDIYIVGRKKDMIITGGENVYPQEVEQCIITHPQVKEVAVVGLSDSKWGEIVSAFIVSNNSTTNLTEEIFALCREHLGAYKVPKQIFFVDELPKTHVGKIDKKQLVERSV